MSVPKRHQTIPSVAVTTSDGLRRLQLGLEAQIVAAGAAGVSSFNGRFGAVSLVPADISAALGYTPADAADLPTGGHLPISIIDLPLADSSEPLLRWLIDDGMTFTGGSVNSGIAATGSPSIRIRKNGAANGTISSAGVVSFTNAVYAPGDIFELYPPTAVDATWDRIAITLETT